MLIEAIVTSKDLAEAKWNSFSLTIDINGDGEWVKSSGYAFGGDTAIPFCARFNQLDPVLDPYLRKTFGDGPYPVRLIIQFSAESGRYSIDFEDSDARRWSSLGRLE